MKSHSFIVMAIFLLAIIFSKQKLSSQNLAINSDGSDPEPSAMLDIKPDVRSLMIPGLTEANRPASPATGLLTCQTDGNAGFYYFDGSGWQQVGNLEEPEALVAAETTARQTRVSNLQTEPDATRAGAGLDTDGSYTANGSANYISTAASLKDADRLPIAQAPETLWTKTFGGVLSDDGYSVQQTTDGGFIITGQTYSYGVNYANVWLIRTDEDGDTLWTKTFGTNGVDEGRSVQQTSDGGFIITGSVFSQGKGLQVWLIKTNASGDSLWSKDFGGLNNEMGYCVQQTNDGGYIITGEVVASGNLTDLWLIKTDSDGNYLWSKNYGGTGFDKGYSVQQTTDGGYIVTGYTGSFGAGYNDVWLLKTDAAGDTIWTKTYGGFDNDYGYSVEQTTDGGYFITGTSWSFSPGSRIYLIKTDSAGDTLWTKSYSGSRGYSGQQTSDGGYIITGWAEPLGPANSNVWLLRTDSSGDTLWTKIFGADGYEQGRSVQQTSDGGYILCGFTDSYGAGAYDIWLIRVAAEITAVKEKTQADCKIYPNPTREKFSVSGLEPGVEINRIAIIDSFGKVIKSFAGELMTHGISFDVSNLPAGMYFCKFYFKDRTITRELIIHR